MKQSAILIIVFLIIGLIIGYIIFGKINNRYISVLSLLGFHKDTFSGFFTKTGDQFGVFDKMRLNILFCGLGGIIGGIIIGTLLKRR